MTKRYSDGTVRYRVRTGKDGIERGHWEALIKVSEDDGPWKCKSKALKTYMRIDRTGQVGYLTEA